jgi:hypothetical protein
VVDPDLLPVDAPPPQPAIAITTRHAVPLKTTRPGKGSSIARTSALREKQK